jgi:hypothetical protein
MPAMSFDEYLRWLESQQAAPTVPPVGAPPPPQYAPAPPPQQAVAPPMPIPGSTYAPPVANAIPAPPLPVGPPPQPAYIPTAAPPAPQLIAQPAPQPAPQPVGPPPQPAYIPTQQPPLTTVQQTTEQPWYASLNEPGLARPGSTYIPPKPATVYDSDGPAIGVIEEGGPKQDNTYNVGDPATLQAELLEREIQEVMRNGIYPEQARVSTTSRYMRIQPTYDEARAYVLARRADAKKAEQLKEDQATQKQEAKDEAQRLEEEQMALAIAQGQETQESMQQKMTAARVTFGLGYFQLNERDRQIVDAGYAATNNPIIDAIGGAKDALINKLTSDERQSNSSPDPNAERINPVDWLAEALYNKPYWQLNSNEQRQVQAEARKRQLTEEFSDGSMTEEQVARMVAFALQEEGLTDSQGNVTTVNIPGWEGEPVDVTSLENMRNVERAQERAAGGLGINKATRNAEGSVEVPLAGSDELSQQLKTQFLNPDLLALNRVFIEYANKQNQLANQAPAFVPTSAFPGQNLAAVLGEAQGNVLTGSAVQDWLSTAEGQQALANRFNYNSGVADVEGLYEDYYNSMSFWQQMGTGAAYDYTFGLTLLLTFGGKTTVTGARALAATKFRNAKPGSLGAQLYQALVWADDNAMTFADAVDWLSDPAGNIAMRGAVNAAKGVRNTVFGKSTQQGAKEARDAIVEAGEEMVTNSTISPSAGSAAGGGGPSGGGGGGGGGPLPSISPPPTGGGGGAVPGTTPVLPTNLQLTINNQTFVSLGQINNFVTQKRNNITNLRVRMTQMEQAGEVDSDAYRTAFTQMKLEQDQMKQATDHFNRVSPLLSEMRTRQVVDGEASTPQRIAESDLNVQPGELEYTIAEQERLNQVLVDVSARAREGMDVSDEVTSIQEQLTKLASRRSDIEQFLRNGGQVQQTTSPINAAAISPARPNVVGTTPAEATADVTAITPARPDADGITPATNAEAINPERVSETSVIEERTQETVENRQEASTNEELLPDTPDTRAPETTPATTSPNLPGGITPIPYREVDELLSDTPLPRSGQLPSLRDVRTRAISDDANYRGGPQSAADRRALLANPQDPHGWSFYPRTGNVQSFNNFKEDMARMIARNPLRVDIIRDYIDMNMMTSGLNKMPGQYGSGTYQEILNLAASFAAREGKTLPPINRNIQPGVFPPNPGKRLPDGSSDMSEGRMVVGTTNAFHEFVPGDTVDVDLALDRTSYKPMEIVGWWVPESGKITDYNTSPSPYPASQLPPNQASRAALINVRDADGNIHAVHPHQLRANPETHGKYIPGVTPVGGSRLEGSAITRPDNVGTQPNATPNAGTSAPPPPRNTDAPDDLLREEDFSPGDPWAEDEIISTKAVTEGDGGTNPSQGPAMEAIESAMVNINTAIEMGVANTFNNSQTLDSLKNRLTNMYVRLGTQKVKDEPRYLAREVTTMLNQVDGMQKRLGGNDPSMINVRLSLLKIIDHAEAQDDALKMARPPKFVSRNNPWTNFLVRNAHSVKDNVINLGRAPWNRMYLDTSLQTYIGRAQGDLAESIWHNPFHLKKGQQNDRLARMEVIRKYAVRLAQDDELFSRLWELYDKQLACWCSPNACHGHLLALLANMTDEQRDAWRRHALNSYRFDANGNPLLDELGQPKLHPLLPEHYDLMHEVSELERAYALGLQEIAWQDLQKGLTAEEVRANRASLQFRSPEGRTFRLVENSEYVNGNQVPAGFSSLVDIDNGEVYLQGTDDMLRQHFRDNKWRVYREGSLGYRATPRPTLKGRVKYDGTLGGHHLSQALAWLRVPNFYSRRYFSIEKKEMLQELRDAMMYRNFYEDVEEYDIDPDYLTDLTGQGWWMATNDNVEFESPFIEDLSNRGLDVLVEAPGEQGMSFNPIQEELANPGERSLRIRAYDPITDRTYIMKVEHPRTEREVLALEEDVPMQFSVRNAQGRGSIDEEFVVMAHRPALKDADGKIVIDKYTGFPQKDMSKPLAYRVYYRGDSMMKQPVIKVDDTGKKVTNETGQYVYENLKDVQEQIVRIRQSNKVLSDPIRPVNGPTAKEIKAQIARNNKLLTQLENTRRLLMGSEPVLELPSGALNGDRKEVMQAIQEQLQEYAEGRYERWVEEQLDINPQIALASLMKIAPEWLNNIFRVNADDPEFLAELAKIGIPTNARRSMARSMYSAEYQRQLEELAKLKGLDPKTATQEQVVAVRQVLDVSFLNTLTPQQLDAVDKAVYSQNPTYVAQAKYRAQIRKALPMLALDERLDQVTVLTKDDPRVALQWSDIDFASTEMAIRQLEDQFKKNGSMTVDEAVIKPFLEKYQRQKQLSNMVEDWVQSRVVVKLKEKQNKDLLDKVLGSMLIDARFNVVDASVRQQSFTPKKMQQDPPDGTNNLNDDDFSRHLRNPDGSRKKWGRREADPDYRDEEVYGEVLPGNMDAASRDPFGDSRTGGTRVTVKWKNPEQISLSQTTRFLDRDEAIQWAEKKGYQSWEYEIVRKLFPGAGKSDTKSHYGFVVIRKPLMFDGKQFKTASDAATAIREAGIDPRTVKVVEAGEPPKPNRAPQEPVWVVESTQKYKPAFTEATYKTIEEAKEAAKYAGVRWEDVEVKTGSLTLYDKVNGRWATTTGGQRKYFANMDEIYKWIGERNKIRVMQYDPKKLSKYKDWSDDEMLSPRVKRNRELRRAELVNSQTDSETAKVLLKWMTARELNKEMTARENFFEWDNIGDQFSPSWPAMSEAVDKQLADALAAVREHFVQKLRFSEERMFKLLGELESNPNMADIYDYRIKSTLMSAEQRRLQNQLDLHGSKVQISIDRVESGGVQQNVFRESANVFHPQTGKRERDGLYGRAFTAMRAVLDADGLSSQAPQLAADMVPTAPTVQPLVFERNNLNVQILQDKSGRFYVMERPLNRPQSTPKMILMNYETQDAARRAFEQLRGFSLDPSRKSLQKRVRPLMNNKDSQIPISKIDRDAGIVRQDAFVVEGDSETVIAIVTQRKTEPINKVAELMGGTPANKDLLKQVQDKAYVSVQLFNRAKVTPGRNFLGLPYKLEPHGAGQFRVVPSDALPNLSFGGTNNSKKKLVWADPERTGFSNQKEKDLFHPYVWREVGQYDLSAGQVLEANAAFPRVGAVPERTLRVPEQDTIRQMLLDATNYASNSYDAMGVRNPMYPDPSDSWESFMSVLGLTNLQRKQLDRNFLTAKTKRRKQLEAAIRWELEREKLLDKVSGRPLRGSGLEVSLDRMQQVPGVTDVEGPEGVFDEGLLTERELRDLQARENLTDMQYQLRGWLEADAASRLDEVDDPITAREMGLENRMEGSSEYRLQGEVDEEDLPDDENIVGDEDDFSPGDPYADTTEMDDEWGGFVKDVPEDDIQVEMPEIAPIGSESWPQIDKRQYVRWWNSLSFDDQTLWAATIMDGQRIPPELWQRPRLGLEQLTPRERAYQFSRTTKVTTHQAKQYTSFEGELVMAQRELFENGITMPIELPDVINQHLINLGLVKNLEGASNKLSISYGLWLKTARETYDPRWFETRNGWQHLIERANDRQYWNIVDNSDVYDRWGRSFDNNPTNQTQIKTELMKWQDNEAKRLRKAVEDTMTLHEAVALAEREALEHTTKYNLIVANLLAGELDEIPGLRAARESMDPWELSGLLWQAASAFRFDPIMTRGAGFNKWEFGRDMERSGALRYMLQLLANDNAYKHRPLLGEVASRTAALNTVSYKKVASYRLLAAFRTIAGNEYLPQLNNNSELIEALDFLDNANNYNEGVAQTHLSVVQPEGYGAGDDGYRYMTRHLDTIHDFVMQNPWIESVVKESNKAARPGFVDPDTGMVLNDLDLLRLDQRDQQRVKDMVDALARDNGLDRGTELTDAALRRQVSIMLGFPEQVLRASGDGQYVSLPDVVWYRANGSSSPLAFTDVDGVEGWRFLMTTATVSRMGMTPEQVVATYGEIAGKIMLDKAQKDVERVVGMTQHEFIMWHSLLSSERENLDEIMTEILDVADKMALPEETQLTVQRKIGTRESNATISMAGRSSSLTKNIAGKAAADLTPKEQKMAHARLLNTIMVAFNAGRTSNRHVVRSFVHEAMHALIQIGRFSPEEYKVMLDYARRTKIDPNNLDLQDPVKRQKIQDLADAFYKRPVKLEDLSYADYAKVVYAQRALARGESVANVDTLTDIESLTIMYSDFYTDDSWFRTNSSKMGFGVMDRLRQFFVESWRRLRGRPNGQQIFDQLRLGTYAEDMKLKQGFRPEGSRGFFTTPLTDAQRADTSTWQVSETLDTRTATAKRVGDTPVDNSLALTTPYAPPPNTISGASREEFLLTQRMPFQTAQSKSFNEMASQVWQDVKILGNSKAGRAVYQARKQAGTAGDEYFNPRAKSWWEMATGSILSDDTVKLLDLDIRLPGPGKNVEKAGWLVMRYTNGIERLAELQEKLARMRAVDPKAMLPNAEYQQMKALEAILQSTRSKSGGFAPYVKASEMSAVQRRRVAMKRFEEDLDFHFGLRDQYGVLVDEQRKGVLKGVVKALDNWTDLRRTTALYNVATGPAYVMMNALGNAMTLALTDPTALWNYLTPVFDPNSDFHRARKFKINGKPAGMKFALGPMNERTDAGFVPNIEIKRSKLGLGQTGDLVNSNRDAISQSGTTFSRMRDGSNPWKRAVGTVGNLFAPEELRDFANAFDIHIREALWETAMDRRLAGAKRAIRNHARNTLIQSMRKNGINIGVTEEQLAKVFDDLEASSGGYFSGTDLYNALKQLDNRDAMHNWADRVGRDWTHAIRNMDKAARQHVDRIAFSFKPTKADEVASRFFMFHYWSTRQTWLYVTEAAKKPYLIGAYMNFVDYLDREAEKHNVPSSVREYIALMKTPLGFYTFFQPGSMANTMISFAPWMDKIDSTEGQLLTPLGKAKREKPLLSSLKFTPWFEAMIVASGVMGPDFQATDPLGFDPILRMSVNMANGLNTLTYERTGEGIFTKIGLGVDERGNRVLIDTPQFVNRYRAMIQSIQDYVPTYGDYRLSDVPTTTEYQNKNIFAVAVAQYAADKRLDLLNETQLDEAISAVAMDFSESGPYYQGALSTATGQQSMQDAVAMLGFPFRLKSLPSIEMQLAEAKQMLEDAGITNWNPQATLGYASSANATPEMLALQQEISNFYNVGSKADRTLKKAFAEAKAGKNLAVMSQPHGQVWSDVTGAALVGTQEQMDEWWSALDKSEQRSVAENYMMNTYGPDAMVRVERQWEAEDKYLNDHPIVAGYFGLKDLYDSQENKERFMQLLYQDNPDFAKWVDHEIDDPLTTMDDEGRPLGLTWNGYLALMGKTQTMTGERPDSNLILPKVPGLEGNQSLGDYYLANKKEEDAAYVKGAGKAALVKELSQVADLKAKIYELDPSGQLWQVYLGRMTKTTNVRFDDIVPGSYDIITEYRIGDDAEAYYFPKGWARQFLVDSIKLQEQNIPMNFDEWYEAQIKRLAFDKAVDPEFKAKLEAKSGGATGGGGSTGAAATPVEDIAFDPETLFEQPAPTTAQSNWGKLVRVRERTVGTDPTSGQTVSVPNTIDLVVVSEQTVNNVRLVQVYLPAAKITTWLPAASLKVVQAAAAD